MDHLPVTLVSGVVVTTASVLALLASVGRGTIDWAVALPFAAAGVLGSTAGKRVASHLDDRLLRQGFAVVLAGLSTLLVVLNRPG